MRANIVRVLTFNDDLAARGCVLNICKVDFCVFTVNDFKHFECLSAANIVPRAIAKRASVQLRHSVRKKVKRLVTRSVCDLSNHCTDALGVDLGSKAWVSNCESCKLRVSGAICAEICLDTNFKWRVRDKGIFQRWKALESDSFGA